MVLEKMEQVYYTLFLLLITTEHWAAVSKRCKMEKQAHWLRTS